MTEAKQRLGEILSECVDKDSCLIYKGITPKGRLNRYPILCWNGKRYRGNRLVYLLANGSIDDGKFVCHSCDNTYCLNPKHLWLGTGKENMEDMVKKGRHGAKYKTHCIRGHEMTPENVRWQRARLYNKTLWQVCLKCQTINQRRAHLRRKLAKVNELKDN